MRQDEEKDLVKEIRAPFITKFQCWYILSENLLSSTLQGTVYDILTQLVGLCFCPKHNKCFQSENLQLN